MLGIRASRNLHRVVSSLSSLRLHVEMPFYAVAKGKKPGVYATWPECQAQVTGFLGARYKKFATMTEAEEFIRENSSSNVIDNRQVSSPVTSNKIDIRSSAAGAREKMKQKSLNVNTAFAKNDNNNDDGRLSPTLVQMKQDMKRLQKELSDLRSRFDEYVAEKSRGSGFTSQTQGFHTSAVVPGKRKREKSREEVIDLDLDEPSTSIRRTDFTDNRSNNTKFVTDNDGFLIVFTDGACESNGRVGAKAGVGVYFGRDHPLNVAEPVRGRPTNNTAEIQAATYALELAHASGFDKVAIHTDSQFMINCMTSWLKSWKRNNWKKKDGEPVKNKEDLMDLDKASEGLMVKWVHVKGHSGNVGNEEADRLAREGAKLYKQDQQY
ncbi:ribonuclease H1-like [Penaeus monodon]|uniref:ribonuclease H1-like n=1 Tax=Penaeus monodon TaxID=6687 RepID=UPI0018A7669D|nr:ribonuclease H1-like [Penaeus monodon]